MVKGSAAEKDGNSQSHIGRKGAAGEKEFELAKKGDAKSHFDITSLPGCRLLSEREKKLCSSMRLRPTQYVTLKTLILKVSCVCLWYSDKRIVLIGLVFVGPWPKQKGRDEQVLTREC